MELVLTVWMALELSRAGRATPEPSVRLDDWDVMAAAMPLIVVDVEAVNLCKVNRVVVQAQVWGFVAAATSHRVGCGIWPVCAAGKVVGHGPYRGDRPAEGVRKGCPFANAVVLDQ